MQLTIPGTPPWFSSHLPFSLSWLLSSGIQQHHPEALGCSNIASPLFLSNLLNGTKSDICGFVSQRQTMGRTGITQLSWSSSFGCLCAAQCGAGRWCAACLQAHTQLGTPTVLLGHILLSRFMPLFSVPGLSSQNLEQILALV